MDATLRVHQRWFVLLALLLGVIAAACGDGSTSTPTPHSPATSSTSDNVESSDVIPPTMTTTIQTTPSTEPPLPDTRLPRALVGSWSASTSQSGALELVLAADGSFHQYGGSLDWRGKATVRGTRITFTGTDGKSSTYGWSISGGTLTLAGITYLKTDAGTGGNLALVGTWMGMDDIFETLVFNNDGTFERQHDAQGTVGGTFQVQNNSVTLRPNGGAATTATWSVSNGILTLRTSSGPKQYARSG